MGPILALDTATDAPGVALRHDGRTSVRAIGWRAAFRETVPAAAALLAEADLTLDDLEGIVVPAGPGSFTGLRVGATLAVALARARGIPLHAVPTLEAVAAAYAPAGAVRVCAVLDARRGRWYAARCERDGAGWRSLEDPRDLAPDAVAVLAAGATIVGMSLERLAPAIPAGLDIAPVPASPDPAPVAQALTALVALAPSAYRLAAPAELRILYARSGVD